MYDVVIVGARCAGSALALMLAREGLRVLAIDRTTFPSDTMSGHFIQPAGVSCLRRLGLLEDLEALGAPAQETMTSISGRSCSPAVRSRRRTGQPSPMRRAAIGSTRCSPTPRSRQAPACAKASASSSRWSKAGASSASGPGQPQGGQRTSAPGSSSAPTASVPGWRRLSARKVYDRRPAATCCYYAYWSGFDAPSTRLFVRDGLFCVTVPTNDGLTFLGVAWPHADLARVRADIANAYHQAAATIPWIADRLASRRTG